MVSGNTAGAVRTWARKELEPDRFVVDAGRDGYRTTSLYFDNARFDIYHGRGPHAPVKYRIRRYDDADVVYLERKTKIGGRIVKRRSAVALHDLPEVIGGRSDSRHWFARLLRDLKLHPVCQISYSRTARVGTMAGGPVRLTIDQQIAGAAMDSITFEDRPLVELMPGTAIVELKYRGAMPSLFQRLIEAFGMEPEPRSTSKYRLAAHALGLARAVQPAFSQNCDPD